MPGVIDSNQISLRDSGLAAMAEEKSTNQNNLNINDNSEIEQEKDGSSGAVPDVKSPNTGIAIGAAQGIVQETVKNDILKNVDK